MNILYLPLKKEWYKMIEAGVKKEEYRDMSPYWFPRLSTCTGLMCNGRTCFNCKHLKFKCYDAVCFSYGYTKRQMLWECKGITIGQGRPEWGAPDHKTFIIKLGNRLNDERLQ